MRLDQQQGDDKTDGEFARFARQRVHPVDIQCIDAEGTAAIVGVEPAERRAKGFDRDGIVAGDVPDGQLHPADKGEHDHARDEQPAHPQDVIGAVDRQRCQYHGNNGEQENADLQQRPHRRAAQDRIAHLELRNETQLQQRPDDGVKHEHRKPAAGRYRWRRKAGLQQAQHGNHHDRHDDELIGCQPQPDIDIEPGPGQHEDR